MPDSLFITDLGPFESFQDKYLKNVKACLRIQGIKLTSGRRYLFDLAVLLPDTWGNGRGTSGAGHSDFKTLGSPAFR